LLHPLFLPAHRRHHPKLQANEVDLSIDQHVPVLDRECRHSDRSFPSGESAAGAVQLRTTTQTNNGEGAGTTGALLRQESGTMEARGIMRVLQDYVGAPRITRCG